MALIRGSSPSEYADAACVPYSTSGAGGGTGYVFGFDATTLHLVNDRASAVYVSLATSTPSTAGFKTCSGEALDVSRVPFGALAIAATATSTGTFVRFAAWG